MSSDPESHTERRRALSARRNPVHQATRVFPISSERVKTSRVAPRASIFDAPEAPHVDASSPQRDRRESAEIDPVVTLSLGQGRKEGAVEEVGAEAVT